MSIKHTFVHFVPFVLATSLAVACVAPSEPTTEEVTEATPAHVEEQAIADETAALVALLERLGDGVAPAALSVAELRLATFHRIDLLRTLTGEASNAIHTVAAELDGLGIPPAEWPARFEEAPSAASEDFAHAVAEYGRYYRQLRQASQPAPSGDVGTAEQALVLADDLAIAALALGAVALCYSWVTSDDVEITHWVCTYKDAMWPFGNCVAWTCMREKVDGPAANECTEGEQK